MECIPVPTQVERDAPMYFRAALMDVAEEWVTHKNKLLKVKQRVPIHHTVPKTFPYFAVEWDDGGYAQVLESESFPKSFGVDTIANMLDIEPMRYNKRREDDEKDRKSVLGFVEQWKKFDWTVELDGGEFVNDGGK
jgi:hypothetical protein